MSTFYVTTKATGPKGIVAVEAEVGSAVPSGEEAITVGDKVLIVGKDAFVNLADARLDAVERAKKKIRSIVKAENKLNLKIAQWEAP